MMDKKLREQYLKELAPSVQGKALLDYLEEKISELNTVEDAKDWDDVSGKKKAVEFLKSIFNFLGKIGEKSPEKPRNQYL